MIEFISRLPQGYQEVEYIESSGTQYIVVDFIPNQDTRLDMLVEPRSVVAAESGVGFIPYGSAESYNSKAFECYTNATGKLEFNYGSQYQTDLANISVGTKINISHNKNNIVVTDTNGRTIASHSFNYKAFTCPRNLALFAINRSTAIVGQTRIYSCQIYNDTTLALVLVPCYRKSDNIVGLYDLVNGVFYTNAGTGNFAKGKNSNSHSDAVITPGGVIPMQYALRRIMMNKDKKGPWIVTLNGMYRTAEPCSIGNPVKYNGKKYTVSGLNNPPFEVNDGDVIAVGYFNGNRITQYNRGYVAVDGQRVTNSAEKQCGYYYYTVRSDVVVTGFYYIDPEDTSYWYMGANIQTQ